MRMRKILFTGSIFAILAIQSVMAMEITGLLQLSSCEFSSESSEIKNTLINRARKNLKHQRILLETLAEQEELLGVAKRTAIASTVGAGVAVVGLSYVAPQIVLMGGKLLLRTGGSVAATIRYAPGLFIVLPALVSKYVVAGSGSAAILYQLNDYIKRDLARMDLAKNKISEFNQQQELSSVKDRWYSMGWDDVLYIKAMISNLEAEIKLDEEELEYINQAALEISAICKNATH